MRDKIYSILLIGFFVLLFGFLFFWDYVIEENIKIPVLNPKEKSQPYISYEEGGQPYGIDAFTMVGMIDVMGDRK